MKTTPCPHVPMFRRNCGSGYDALDVVSWDANVLHHYAQKCRHAIVRSSHLTAIVAKVDSTAKMLNHPFATLMHGRRAFLS